MILADSCSTIKKKPKTSFVFQVKEDCHNNILHCIENTIASYYTDFVCLKSQDNGDLAGPA